MWLDQDIQLSIYLAVFRLLLLSSLIVFSCASEAQKDVRLIEIHSGWGGLGTPQKAAISIKRKDNRFVRDGKPVSATQVQALVTALLAAPVTKPDMANLGVTPSWLRTKVASQRPRAWAQATETTANQQRMFNESFTNVDLVAKVLRTLFTYTKFDDYPFSKVEIVFEDGSKLTAETHSYYVYMLPWKIDGEKAETYNADISRSLASLFPSIAVNKERLSGDGLAPQLTDAVMRSIEREWNLLGSDERAGEALRMLRTAYEVVTAELTPYHHPEYGTATYKGEPEEMNLHASVRKSSSPPNVTDALVLRYAKGKVEGVDGFLKVGRQV